MVRIEKNTPRDKKILDGEWGIHFSDKSLPEERFDPFHSYVDQNGTRIGHRTIFNPIRLQRPIEFALVKPIKKRGKHTHFSDTFCELVQGKLPAIVITKDNFLVNDFFCLKPRAENLNSSIVFTAINLYPPISRIFTNRKLNHDHSKNLPTGLSFIHVFTNHYKLPEDVPISGWKMFFQNYQLTLKESIGHPTISLNDNLRNSITV